MIAERLESMSPRGFLRLMRQEDGDIIITVGEGDDEGGWKGFSSVEFCTPFAGGGGSQRTHRALIQLIAAMAKDNLDDSQAGRRPPRVDMDVQRRLVEWGKQCRVANKDVLKDKIERLRAERDEAREAAQDILSHAWSYAHDMAVEQQAKKKWPWLEEKE